MKMMGNPNFGLFFTSGRNEFFKVFLLLGTRLKVPVAPGHVIFVAIFDIFQAAYFGASLTSRTLICLQKLSSTCCRTFSNGIRA